MIPENIDIALMTVAVTSGLVSIVSVGSVWWLLRSVERLTATLTDLVKVTKPRHDVHPVGRRDGDLTGSATR